MGRLTGLAEALSAYSEVVLDSSVWLAVFRDEPAADAVADLDGVRPVTTPIVIAEVLAHVHLGRAPPDAPLSAMVEDARFEPLVRDDAATAAETYARLRAAGARKVSLADTLIHATARRIGACLLTLDRDLLEEPNVLVLDAST